jgi:toxin ParE1/3/4
MTLLSISGRVEQDLARITMHLLEHDVENIAARVEEVLDALQLLRRHPLIGRPVRDGLRELVIGRGARGYVARYRYDAATDEVRVAALRAQQEAGFGDR